MKKLVFCVLVLFSAALLQGEVLEYDGENVFIDGTIGSGSFSTMFVIDWQSGVTPSHAWIYEYDGTKTVADGLDALEAEIASFDWSNSSFVSQLDYNDGVDAHTDASGGWVSVWNKDSGVWITNPVGVMEQELMDGGWSGIVANDYTWGDAPPAIPVPEPGMMALVGLGAVLLRRRRSL